MFSATSSRKKVLRGGKIPSTVPMQPVRVPKPSQDSAARLPRKPAKIGKLIIGIDLGTTRVAVATQEVLYAKSSRPRKDLLPKIFCHWPAAAVGGDYRFPSTAIYYESCNVPPITGNDLTFLIEDPAFEPSRLIRQLKMLFHHHNNDPTTIAMHAKVQKQLARVGKSADEALFDLAKVILDILLEDRDGTGCRLSKEYDRFQKLDLELVIAVPPGRSTVDHARVRQAFIQGPITSTAVYVESEPAAMFRSWVYDGQITRDWAVGRTFLIADIGGGTCCIVRLCLQTLEPSLGFKQEYPSQSIAYGAETISDAFLSLASSKVPKDWPEREIEISKIGNKFETSYKRGFGRDPSFTMKFERSGTRREYWEFTFDEIACCFDVCISKLIEGLEQELSRGHMDYLVLGGGLASNHYVHKAIVGHFKDVKVRELGAGKEHVVVGSILARLDENFLVDYPITRSKAVTTWFPVTAKIRKSGFYHRLVIESSPTDVDAEYFLGATWLVKKGGKGAKVQEVASENNIEEARERHLDPKCKAPEFSETIITFDYDPGNEEWAAECADGEDDTWINMRGEPIPAPEHQEKITWSPWSKEVAYPGFELADLDDAEDEGKKYKILKYSIKMKVTETSTTTWAKIWSSDAMKKKNNGEEVAFRSEPVAQEPIFAEAQNVSHHLKESFDIDIQIAPSSSKNMIPNAVSSPSSSSRKQRPVRAKAPSTKADGMKNWDEIDDDEIDGVE